MFNVAVVWLLEKEEILLGLSICLTGIVLDKIISLDEHATLNEQMQVRNVIKPHHYCNQKLLE